MSRNFYCAADSPGSMHEVDDATELVRYQITNYTGAISRPSLRHHVCTTTLLPVDGKPALSVSVSLMAPAHPDTTVCSGKCTELCGIGRKLVEYHRKCLTRLGA